MHNIVILPAMAVVVYCISKWMLMTSDSCVDFLFYFLTIQVKLFFESIKEHASEVRSHQFALDNLQKNIRWMQRNLETLKNCLSKKQYSWQKKNLSLLF